VAVVCNWKQLEHKKPYTLEVTIHKTMHKHRTQNRKQNIRNKKTNVKRIINKHKTTNWNIFRSVSVVLLRTKETNTCRKGSQKHNYICNIQGVSIYTNVSANYTFRLLLVRPSSGWILWSEEMYNGAI